MKLLWLLFLLVSLSNLVLAQESFVFRAKKIQATPDLVYQPGEILIRESKIIRIGIDSKAQKSQICGLE